MNRLAEFKGRAERLLLDDAGLLDQGNIGGCAAVAYRRLVRVHLDEGIVDAEPCQGREDMLNGLDLGISLNERGGPLDSLHIIDQGIHDRFVRQVGAAEFVAVPRRCWVDGEGDVAAVVQGGAAQAGRLGEGALEFHGKSSVS